MRERLKELLEDAPRIAFSKDESEEIADYLIENGVIVPPCKVGDKVYKICFGKLSEQKIIKKSKVTAIKITDKITITLDYATNLYDTDIGTWLFVGVNAKEEAEAALKGGAE